MANGLKRFDFGDESLAHFLIVDFNFRSASGSIHSLSHSEIERFLLNAVLQDVPQLVFYCLRLLVGKKIHVPQDVLFGALQLSTGRSLCALARLDLDPTPLPFPLVVHRLDGTVATAAPQTTADALSSLGGPETNLLLMAGAEGAAGPSWEVYRSPLLVCCVQCNPSVALNFPPKSHLRGFCAWPNPRLGTWYINRDSCS